MQMNILFPILVGIATGFLAGLGIGGGSLLILWLTAVLGMGHAEARSINLLCFLPSALIASLFRWRQGSLDLPKVIPAVIAGSISAIAGTWLSTRIHIALLEKLFGILLLCAGIKELLYRPLKAR